MVRPPTVKMKQGDLLPALTVVLRDGNKAAVDLSAASAVTLRVRKENSTTLIIDSTVGIDNATGGEVTYDWSTGDTDVEGDYLAEFEAILAGKPLTFPNDEEIDLIIRRELG